MSDTHFSSVLLVNHPLAQHNLSLIRDKNNKGQVFKSAFDRLAEFLLHAATQNLPLTSASVDTPLMKTTTQVLDSSYEIILAPILRAGLGLSEVATKLISSATVYHIGMYRDEATFEPVWYYNKTPSEFKNPSKTKVFILDPMLATGGSALAAIDLFITKGVMPQDIVFVCVICAPEGLKLITQKYPQVQIITAALDDTLNENAYILPGLGDAGDRLFNTDK